MNDHTDGIHHPGDSETVDRDPALEAIDRWADRQDDPAAWDAVMAALGPADGPADDLAGAYKALAEASPEGREKARAAMRKLVAGRQPLNARTWALGEPPARKWILADWLPARTVSSLYGWGGVGKSSLSLQLAAAVAADRTGLPSDHLKDWIGGKAVGPTLGNAVPVKGLPVVVASYEDDHHEQARRLSALSGSAAPWVSPDQLNNLHLVDLAGRGPLWGVGVGKHTSTAGELQETGRRLQEHCAKLGAGLVVLDPLAAVYRASEIDRALVRDFLSAWDAWAREQSCAVLLLAHQSRTRDATSGSTDWEAGARSVWTLGKEPLCGPPEKHTGRTHFAEKCGLGLQLALAKANYADMDAADKLAIGWDYQGGGRRLTIRGRWLEERNYDPTA